MHARWSTAPGRPSSRQIQGFLAHKKPPPPLGPYRRPLRRISLVQGFFGPHAHELNECKSFYILKKDDRRAFDDGSSWVVVVLISLHQGSHLLVISCRSRFLDPRNAARIVTLGLIPLHTILDSRAPDFIFFNIPPDELSTFQFPNLPTFQLSNFGAL